MLTTQLTVSHGIFSALSLVSQNIRQKQNLLLFFFRVPPIPRLLSRCTFVAGSHSAPQPPPKKGGAEFLGLQLVRCSIQAEEFLVDIVLKLTVSLQAE